MTSARIMAIDVSYAAPLRGHLERCNDDYHVPLSLRVDLDAYSLKLLSLGSNQAVIDSKGDIRGHAGAYINREDGVVFLSNLSLERAYRGMGLGAALIDRVTSMFGAERFSRVELEVSSGDFKAQKFYMSYGFRCVARKPDRLIFQKTITGE